MEKEKIIKLLENEIEKDFINLLTNGMGLPEPTTFPPKQEKYLIIDFDNLPES